MTHPTGTLAATPDGKDSATRPSGLNAGPLTAVIPVLAFSTVSKSSGHSANFLEMLNAPFHYSVIHGDATIATAPGVAACHHLNDEAAASTLAAGIAGPGARAGDDLYLNPDRTGLGFEPAQERRMQMTVVPPTDCSVLSRLRMPQ